MPTPTSENPGCRRAFRNRSASRCTSPRPAARRARRPRSVRMSSEILIRVSTPRDRGRSAPHGHRAGRSPRCGCRRVPRAASGTRAPPAGAHRSPPPASGPAPPTRGPAEPRPQSTPPTPPGSSAVGHRNITVVDGPEDYRPQFVGFFTAIHIGRLPAARDAPRGYPLSTADSGQVIAGVVLDGVVRVAVPGSGRIIRPVLHTPILRPALCSTPRRFAAAMPTEVSYQTFPE